MKKTSRIKNRIIAGILSAVTIISVGAMSVTSTAAFAIPGIAETVLSTTFGYAKDEVMKLAGPELSKMGLPPILNMVLGLDDNEPTNQDVLDKIDKSTEEIKAEINKVMDEVKELSTQTATYHTQQMNQLKAINSNIDTKDFRVQADTVAADFAHAIKRIDENKANITCDGSDKINNTTYKAYKEILADPKCNVSAMQANFDEMLRFLKGQRTSNNNENGYRQLTNYLMDRVVAADTGKHSYKETPDYYGAVDSINAEIRVMEEQVLMDYAIINALNAMQFRVKEYEIDNGIITVNEDESPYARFENTAANLHSSMKDIDSIFKTVLKENGSIPSKYVVADLYVIDGDTSVKKGCTSFIDAWSQGIDSGKDFNIVVLKKGQYLTADAKKGFKFDNNVKGLNDKGGFEIPAGRNVYIDMYCKSNGFDCSAKKDLDLFTIRDGASLELHSAKLRGDNRKFVIPDNANNTSLKTKYVEFNGVSYYGTDANPCIEISKKANNTSIDMCWTEFNGEYACRIKNDGKNTKFFEWYVTRSWEKEERGGEYWGT
ncbi:hypothetical protein [Ruminococcus sp.]|uniref:hypothetical protein n=1 Tax=Ruminococcus sp. TaxID=41978 RepID=UPI002E813B18|nr:hypothetical protein [Ruminococcus sp.]MEE3493391.1 hypothetical protein [Ruminococcus sp.]